MSPPLSVYSAPDRWPDAAGEADGILCAGYQLHLTKPVDPSALVAAVAKLAVVTSPSRAAADVPRTSSLTATISTVRSKKGHIGCALFASAEGFPDSHTAAFRQRWLTIEGKSIECSFDRLPPGVYAFAIFHDENDNSLFDTDWLGFPKEGWATSNNAKHLLRAPSFEESRVDLAEGASVHVKVTLRYP